MTLRILGSRIVLFGATTWLLACAAHAQYTPAGTAQAWAGYNANFLGTDSSGNHYFENAQGGTNAAGFWEQANEIAMAVDGYDWAAANAPANLPSYKAEVNSLCAGFSDAHGHDWSSDAFNDDLNWATIAFARAYLATGTASQLADAITNFSTVWGRAQSSAGSGNGLAGLIQVQPPTAPNLDSPVNFTFVIAGNLLTQITGVSTYKSEADNVYTWSMANLYQPTVLGGVCNGHATLTCSKIYDANNLSVGGTTGPADYTYNYGIAIEAMVLEGQGSIAQNVANWLMFNSNNTNDPYVGTYTLNGTAYNVLPNYKQGGVNGAGYNGIAMRGIAFGLTRGALNATVLAWAQANASAVFSIRNASGVSWNNWLTQTPLTGLYSWDDSASMATLFQIPSSSVSVSAPARADAGQSITLNATVLPAVLATAANGSVQFFANGTAVGSPAPVTDNNASVAYTFTTAGTPTITAVYSGDTNYTASTSQAVGITVVGAPSQLAFAAPPASTLVYGNAFGPISVVVEDASGNRTVATSSVTLSVSNAAAAYSQMYTATASNGLAIFPALPVLPGVGTYSYTAASAGLTSTSIGEVVQAATLTVTANPVSRIFDGSDPVFPYTVSGFVNGDTAAVVSGTPSIVSSAMRTAAAGGTYTTYVYPGTLAAANYIFFLQSGTLAVTGGAPQAIVFAGLPNLPHGSSYQLAAFTTSGLPVSYSTSGSNGSISGTTLKVTAAGPVTVTANSAGNVNYAAAASVSQSFTAP